eukprot:CAMPEP_0202907934 /NCGR_PEP_ID=MMETSP1392-20130828/44303_1 /ASSEMBLY_ACC=CAM_ASM_000868 /TAXON_ID=225041 /ORGANISM="Chlamydomonas chlamydogama, Strain SAG 11-48b" /LENGTH=62 /DNA_ID=CAMNT_0049597021 /DNA_START=106 /DNA_END=290 /DNA_ORIENTATION=-
MVPICQLLRDRVLDLPCWPHPYTHALVHRAGLHLRGPGIVQISWLLADIDQPHHNGALGEDG